MLLRIILRTFFLSLLFLFLLPASEGQEIRISGQLLDAGSSEPVTYGVIRLEDQAYGAVSNAEGEFELVIPQYLVGEDAVIRISSIGYATKRVPLQSLLSDESEEIQLKAQPYQLGEVVIYSSTLTAREFAKAAFRMLKKNFSRKPFLLKSFYRHYCEEGGTYGRLIEAAVDIYAPNGVRKPQSKTKDQYALRLKQLRRSFDFTSLSDIRHLPIALNQTLDADAAGIKTPFYTHLNSAFWQYYFSDTTIYDGAVVYVITAEGKVDSRNFTCRLFVSASDLAIIRYEETEGFRFHNARRHFEYENRMMATYSTYRGIYYLNYLSNEGERIDQFRDSTGALVRDNGHKHHIEWMANEIITEGIIPYKGKEPSREEMLKMDYDPKFWQGYTVLKATPLETAIEEDLAKRMPLEEQFSQFNLGAESPGVQDILAMQKLEAILRENRERLVILAFWDQDYKPGLRELLLARKVAKEYMAAPVTVVFLSVEPDEISWRNAIQKKRLFFGVHLRLGKGLESEIAKKYGVESIPWFVLLGPDGKVELQGAKIPSASQIQEQMDRLLDQLAGKG